MIIRATIDTVPTVVPRHTSAYISLHQHVCTPGTNRQHPKWKMKKTKKGKENKKETWNTTEWDPRRRLRKGARNKTKPPAALCIAAPNSAASTMIKKKTRWEKMSQLVMVSAIKRNPRQALMHHVGEKQKQGNSTAQHRPARLGCNRFDAR